MSTLGVYDMTGNVREWCFNEAEGGLRATRGAAWPDSPFHAGHIIPKSAFDRDPTNGFRLIQAFDSEGALAALRYPVRRTVLRDYWSEEPASDAEFEAFRRSYAYDHYPLNAVVERVDTVSGMIREKIAFDVPYGERGGAILFRPLEAPAPLQPIVYWGGSGLLARKSIEEEWLPAYDFLALSGRAVVVPIFKGAYERDDALFSITHGSIPGGWGGATYRDYTVHWVKDLRACIDYLADREDLDSAKVGFFGLSFGGLTAPIVLAVEPRIVAAVVAIGGLYDGVRFMPEIDPINFVPRVTTPILMMNGRHDIVFNYETEQLPMYELLGTSSEEKHHHLVESAHSVPREDYIRETLAWFDKYLGVPGG
jgi:dienelactone hydrolase